MLEAVRTETPRFVRKRPVRPPDGEREIMMMEALRHPHAIQRELNNRSLYSFMRYFWPLVSAHEFVHNWHIEYLCHELEIIAERVAARTPREYDLIIKLPPR